MKPFADVTECCYFRIMTTTEAGYIVQKLKDKGVVCESGLTDDEISEIETKFNFTFPPDLKLLLQTALPVSGEFINWRQGLRDKEEEGIIISKIVWPLNGMLFDLQSNDFWVDSWGIRPDKFEDKVLVAKKYYETYPKLIPIYSHRYIPSDPNSSGNPVFSVYQMDIIYYGYDLATYFSNEFHFELSADFEIPEGPKRAIEFWSEQAG